MPIIKGVGGARNLQVLYQGISVVTRTLKWIVGMGSSYGVLFNWAMEMVERTLGRVQTIAETINKYDMLDYVEWKTGRRSEGVTMAVEGLLRKMVINNIDTTVGNLVIDALGFDPKRAKQPAAFMKWAPTLYLLVPAVDSFLFLLARLFYRYPAALRHRVEAELIERRALAQTLAEETEPAAVH